MRKVMVSRFTESWAFGCVAFDVWTTGTGRLLVDDGMRVPAMKGTLMVEREAIKRNFDSRVEARVANADAAAPIMKLTDVLPSKRPSGFELSSRLAGLLCCEPEPASSSQPL